MAKARRRQHRFVAKALPPAVQKSAVTPARVRQRAYDCCGVERVRGWLGGTVVVTTVHQEHCPVWSRR
ncbi:hypothetical protein Stsp01_53370 [Streptomyces sp. NBRC 13847]|nr:hypothetical protein Stsp01_53370 [Streptomyces sp. NBRC 13847]